MPLTALDYEEIRELLAEFCWALDFGDADAVVATFTPEGEFSLAGPDAVTDQFAGQLPGPREGQGFFKGPEGLRRFAALFYQTAQGQVRHCTSATRIRPGAEAGTAHADSYITTVRVGEFPSSGLILTGIYRDELAKTRAGWRFTARTFSCDPQPEHARLASQDVLVRRFDEQAGSRAPGGLAS